MVSPRRRFELFDPFRELTRPEPKPKPKRLEFAPVSPELEPQPIPSEELGPSPIEEGIETGLQTGLKVGIATGRLAARGIGVIGRPIGKIGEAAARKGVERLARPIREFEERRKQRLEQRREEKELQRLEKKVIAEKGRLITQQDILEQDAFKQEQIRRNVEQQRLILEQRLQSARTPEEISQLEQKRKELGQIKVGRIISPQITQFRLQQIKKKQEELSRKEQEIQLRKQLLAGKKAIILPAGIKTPEVSRAGRIIQLSQEISTLEQAKNSLFQQMQLTKTPIQRLAIQNRINNLNTRIGLRSAELNRLR